MDEAVATHSPVAFAAPAGTVNLLSVDAEADEFASSRAWSSPLFPIVKAHSSAQPAVQRDHFRVRNAAGVVVHRSAKVEREVGHHFARRDSSRSQGEGADFGFEFLLAFLRPPDFPAHDLKAEEAGFAEFDHLAFGLVNDELQPL